MAVDTALVAGVAGHAKCIQQLFAAEHPLGLLQQAMQQAKFVASQVQRFAAIADLHAIMIDLEQRGSRLDDRSRRHSLENRADPGGHFPRAERLDHIVVGTDFQTHDPIDLTIPSGKKDDRNVAETPEMLTRLESTDIRQAHIEDDQVRRGVLLVLEGGGAKAQPSGVKALALQGEHQRIGDGGFVFDNQNMRHGVRARQESCRNGAPSLGARQSGKSTGRFIRGKPPRRVDRCAELAKGLGADQQWVIETAAVGQVDLDGALDVAQAQFQVNHRTLGGCDLSSSSSSSSDRVLILLIRAILCS